MGLSSSKGVISYSNVKAAKYLSIGVFTLRRYKNNKKLHSNKYLILNI